MPTRKVGPWGFKQPHFPHPAYTAEQKAAFDEEDKTLIPELAWVGRGPNWNAACCRKGTKKWFRYVYTDHGLSSWPKTPRYRTWKVMLKGPTGKTFWMSYITFVREWRWTKYSYHETKAQQAKQAKYQAASAAASKAAETMPMNAFEGILEKYEPQFLKYWPYGPKLAFENWLSGKIKRLDLLYLGELAARGNPTDLSPETIEHLTEISERNSLDTKAQIRFEIMNRVAEAMFYTSILHPDGFGWQRNEAWAMCRMFTSGGPSDWVKPPKNWKALLRARLLRQYHGPIGTAHMPFDARKGGKDVKVIERLIRKAIKDKEEHHQKKFLVYSPHRKLKDMGLPELHAIRLIVDMTFENMC